MILVIGGAYQGKEAFAFSLLERKISKLENEKTADGRTDDYEALLTRPVAVCFHEYIRRLLLDGRDPAEFSAKMLEKNRDMIVVADEVGCGIVPIEPFERQYRETVGRVCQYLAGEAKTVYRVVCGIGIKIKG